MRDVPESIHRKTSRSGLLEGRQFSLMSIREAQRVVCTRMRPPGPRSRGRRTALGVAAGPVRGNGCGARPLVRE